ncbi:MAG TPA: hypothetical protein VHT91_30380 [Kofleriaceae bacterium]|jgi:hypothetical protein|nr:hypothetical protein [Kofleriaceae bacterium]
MDVLARVRRDWLLLLITILAPIAAVYPFLPARPVGIEDLEHPEGRFLDAEVSVDRIEPLPWSFHDSSGTVHTRFAVGWIGERALLIQTRPTLPSGTILHGDLRRLSGEPKKWIAETPALAAIAYDAVLDLTASARGLKLGVFGILLTLTAVAFWLWRFVSPMAPARSSAAKHEPPIDLAALPPRTDEVVAAVIRRHAPSDGFAVYVAIYTLLGLGVPFLIIAMNAEPTFWDAASALRLFGMCGLGFAIAAPVSIWLFVGWARRRRAAFGRVARDGVVTDGVIVDAAVRLARSESCHTVLDIDVIGERGTQRYSGSVRRIRDWARAGTPVCVLTTATERLAIVIAPTGEGFAARLDADHAGV